MNSVLLGDFPKKVRLPAQLDGLLSCRGVVL